MAPAILAIGAAATRRRLTQQLTYTATNPMRHASSALGQSLYATAQGKVAPFCES